MWYIIGAIALFCICFYFYFGHSAMILFWKCMKHDVKISFVELAKMKKDKVNIDKLLKIALKLKEQGGYDVKIKDMMQHECSGGDLSNVVSLLLSATCTKQIKQICISCSIKIHSQSIQTGIFKLALSQTLFCSIH